MARLRRSIRRFLHMEVLEKRFCLTVLGIEPLVPFDAPGIGDVHGQIPLTLEANRGQVDAEIDFLARGHGYTLLLSADQAAMALGSDAGSLVVRMNLLGSNADAVTTSMTPLPGIVNRFHGEDPARWQTGIPTFSHVRYDDVYPGIDVVYYGNQRQLEYDFVVAPWADPNQIRLAFDGIDAATLDRNGNLVLHTPAGELVQRAPILYQEEGGQRSYIDGAFALDENAQLTFDIADYDRTRPLVIDPIFVYATYLGATGEDRGLGITVDSAGNAYVTGQSPNGVNGIDAFVGKLNAAGTSLEFLTSLGGSGLDAGFDITLDAAGNILVVGGTQSGNFPVTPGLGQGYRGGTDAFVAKLNSTGGLIYSRYIGGTGVDFAEGIAVDAAGNAYVTGPTSSSHTSFPVTVGPDLYYNGAYDIFVAKFNADGSGPVYAGYIGGRYDDAGTGGYVTSGHIAVDAQGSAFVSGMTRSNQSTFPDGNGFGSVPGADQTHNGDYDAFIVKVRPDGTNLEYATYIGGRYDDQGFGMAVDDAGNAYITGSTASNQSTFPVRVGPDLTYNGGTDAFVAKLDPAGTNLIFAGYVGGSNLDYGTGLALDAAGSIHLVGHVHSSHTSFPVLGGPDSVFNGRGRNVGDAFVTKVKPDGTGLIYSSFLGGSGEDSAYWIDLDAGGNAYIIGDTTSSQTTFPNGAGLGTLPGWKSTYSGGGDAFVVKISADVITAAAASSSMSSRTGRVAAHRRSANGLASDALESPLTTNPAFASPLPVWPARASIDRGLRRAASPGPGEFARLAGRERPAAWRWSALPAGGDQNGSVPRRRPVAGAPPARLLDEVFAEGTWTESVDAVMAGLPT